MAKGIGDDAPRSPAYHVQQVDYPATRQEIVESASDSEAPIAVINFLKALPKESYPSYEAVLRDFAEAERVFGQGNVRDGQSRENLGKVAAEDISRHR